MSGEPMHVFKVDDGETHWVVARHPAHAIRILAEDVGEDVKAYMRECEPDVSRLERHDVVQVRLDVHIPREMYAREVKDFPKDTLVDCSVVAHVRAGDMADLGEPGIFCSSGY